MISAVCRLFSSLNASARSSTCACIMMRLSGLRSSCDSVARKSSFCPLARKRLLALHLRLLPRREVAGDLDVPAQLAVADRRHDSAAVEARAVLAQVPALVLRAAVLARLAHLLLGPAGLAILGREDEV